MALSFPGSRNIFKPTPEDGDFWVSEGQRSLPFSDTDPAGVYSADDFEIIEGIVNLKTKTSYLTIPGVCFHPFDNLVSNTAYGASAIQAFANGNSVNAPIQGLPHGAVIIAVVVYGNISDETFSMIRATLTTGNNSNMVDRENINTETTSITFDTIDNSLYSYTIFTSSLDTNDQVYSARITYTTKYI